MGDDTAVPSSMYPGGSEDDFNALRKKLVEAEEAITRWQDAFDKQHALCAQLRSDLSQIANWDHARKGGAWKAFARKASERK